MASRFLRLLVKGKEVAQRALPTTSRSGSSFSSQALTTAEEDVVKAAFVKQQTQFREYLQGLSGVPIPMSPDDNKAVMQYADDVRKIREKVGVPSFSAKLADLLESAEEDSLDVRTFLQDANAIRKQLGVEDTLGAGAAMFAALDSVEKKIGRTLTTDDAQGLAALQDQMAALNTKLGLKESDLEMMEGELDLTLAREEITQLRNEALDKINTYKRRDALEDVDIDVKELKPMAYL